MNDPAAGNEPTSRDTASVAACDAVLAEQDVRWQRGERVLVETLLQQQPALQADTEAVLHLVYNEVLLREARGERPRPEEYLVRFPHLATQIQEQFALHAALAPQPDPGEEDGTLHAACDLTPPFSPHGNAAAAPGLTLGDYELLEEIARGGMGVVYKARQRGAARIVALKVIRAGGLATREDVMRFRTEAEAIARLQHPHIVQIHEVGEYNGLPYFSLEFCAGGSLEKKLAEGPLVPHKAAALVEMLARAMQAAHDKGVIHRDLKPANVLLAEDGMPRITDFGLAKKLGGEPGTSEAHDKTPGALTQTGSILGTPSYMAPEQAGGKSKELGPACDIYALGAVLYECLTGRPPFRAATPLDTLMQVLEMEPVPPTQLNTRVPLDLETICLKCLDKLPARRYGGAAGLSADLHRFLAGEPILARPVGRWERAVKWARRRPAVAVLLAAVALSLLAGIAVSTYFAIDAHDQAAASAANARRAEDQAALAAERQRQAQAERDRVAKVNEQLRLAQEKQRLALNRSLMHLARLAYETGDITRVFELLDQQRPGPGESDLRCFEWYVLQRACHAARLTFLAHPVGSGTRLASPLDNGRMCYSPDGQRLATAWPYVVRIHDAETGKELVATHRAPTQAHVVAFDRTGKHLLAVNLYGHQGFLLDKAGAQSLFPGITVLDLQLNRLVQQLAPRNLLAIGVITGRQRVVTFSSEIFNEKGKIEWWEISTGKNLSSREVTGIKPSLIAVRHAFLRDGSRLAVIEDNAIRLLDVANGQEVRTFSLPAGTKAYAAAFSGDGTRLACISLDATLLVWNTQTGQLLLHQTAGTQPQTVFFPCLDISPDGRHVAVSWEQSIKLFTLDTKTNKEVAVFRGHQAPILALVFRPDGQRLATMSADGRVAVWNVGPVPGRFQPGGQALRFQSPRVSPDGQCLAGVVNVESKSEIRVVHIQTGKDVLVLKGPYGAVSGMAFSGDGSLLAFIDDGLQGAKEPGGQVEVWNVRSGVKQMRFPVPAKLWAQLAFSKNGQRLALVADSMQPGLLVTKVWDLPTGKEVLSIEAKGQDNWVPLALDADGKLLACAVAGAAPKTAEVRIWDVDHKQCVGTATVPGGVGHLAISPDGKRLVVSAVMLQAGSYTISTVLWDLTVFQPLQALKGQSDINVLAFSPDGQRLATASQYGIVKVWDAHTGDEVLELMEHRGPIVDDLVFTADGHRLLSAGRGGWVSISDGTPLPPAVALEAQAVSLVAERISVLVLKAAVIESIQADAGLPEPLRQAALDIAGRIHEDASQLNEAAWKVALYPGHKAEAYRLALRQAEAACALEPDTSMALITLGMAQYRLGQYQSAVDTLTRAAKIDADPVKVVKSLNAAMTGATRGPVGFLVLALAHHGLGHAEQAQSYLAAFRERLKQRGGHLVEGEQQWLAETEKTLTGRPPK
jgi:WD40 repeat protein/tRNA A-37 threonylcarbamoyl transferase component Bud32